MTYIKHKTYVLEIEHTVYFKSVDELGKNPRFTGDISQAAKYAGALAADVAGQKLVNKRIIEKFKLLEIVRNK